MRASRKLQITCDEQRASRARTARIDVALVEQLGRTRADFNRACTRDGACIGNPGHSTQCRTRVDVDATRGIEREFTTHNQRTLVHIDPTAAHTTIDNGQMTIANGLYSQTARVFVDLTRVNQCVPRTCRRVDWRGASAVKVNDSRAGVVPGQVIAIIKTCTA